MKTSLFISFAALLLTTLALPSSAVAQARAGGARAGTTGARQYTNKTMIGNATIQIDPETRQLIVIGDEETQAAVAQAIHNLDHPKPQVLIKVVFVEVTLDNDLDVGVEGSYEFKIDGKPVRIETMWEGNPATGGFGRIISPDWSATLHLLATKGKAQILSRPSIMARNNQQAVIVVGQQVPRVTNSYITNDGNVVNTFQDRDIGIILRVTPFIYADRSVEMIVGPEISSLSDKTVQLNPGVSTPIIDKRSAETVVVTPNATTIVIGGLMQKTESERVQKIPLLGDIPILGIPFRRTVKSSARRELLIFMTPYIVEGTRRVRELTVREANYGEAMRENLDPNDVVNNLDTLRLMPDTTPEGEPLDTSHFVDVTNAPGAGIVDLRQKVSPAATRAITATQRKPAQPQPAPPKATPAPKATPEPAKPTVPLKKAGTTAQKASPGQEPAPEPAKAKKKIQTGWKR